MDNIIDKYILLETIDRNPDIINEVDVLKIYDRLSNSDKARVNQALNKVIAQQFNPKFGKFLNKRLYQVTRKLELASILKKIKDGDTTLKKQLFQSIGVIAIDYYEKIIRTRVFKTSMSGNRKLDRIYSRTIEKVFDSPYVIEYIENNIEDVLDEKLRKLFNDDEYKKIMGEDISHRVKSKFYRTIGGRETKLKWKVLDRILDHLPGINNELKKEIKKDIFAASYKDVVAFTKRNSISELGGVLSNAMLDFFYYKTKQTFTDNGGYDVFLNKFIDILQHFLQKDKTKQYFNRELTDYLSVSDVKR